jgi:hypothetical protein
MNWKIQVDLVSFGLGAGAALVVMSVLAASPAPQPSPTLPTQVEITNWGSMPAVEVGNWDDLKTEMFGSGLTRDGGIKFGSLGTMPLKVKIVDR